MSVQAQYLYAHKQANTYSNLNQAYPYIYINF
jgi:hypothetical protein